MLGSKGTLRTAGSRLSTYGGAVVVGDCWCCVWRWELMRCMKVVLPEPAMPIQTIATGGWVGVVEEAMVAGW